MIVLEILTCDPLKCILKHPDFVTTNWMEYFINSKWASDLLFLAVSNQWLKRCICLANEYSLNIGKDGWLRKLWQFFTQIVLRNRMGISIFRINELIIERDGH